MEKFMNEDIRRILNLLDEDILQGLEDLLVKEEGLKQKGLAGVPRCSDESGNFAPHPGVMGGSRTAYRGCIRAAGELVRQSAATPTGDDYVQQDRQ